MEGSWKSHWISFLDFCMNHELCFHLSYLLFEVEYIIKYIYDFDKHNSGARFTNRNHRNSNSMEISFYSHLESNTVIATKFCTWHDSCAVMACAKICRDLMASNGITARRSFHRIWIAGKKSLVKWAPGLILCLHPANERWCYFVATSFIGWT